MSAAPRFPIVLNRVSKKYRLYQEKPQSLKEAIVHLRRSRFTELWAVQDISLEIAEGSSVGLIGPNGSGKSTLLRLMAGIHQPTQGEIFRRGRVAALLELGAGFHPELTGRENVYLNGAIMGLGRRQIAKSFDSIVEFSGVAQFIDNPVKLYSSGMTVRLGFSVAVMIEPDVLLIDEIFAVGDEAFQRRCMDHIYDLQKGGTTIAFVSHSLPAVRSLCDRAVWLDHGRLVREGAVEDVIDGYLRSVNEKDQQRLMAIRDSHQAAAMTRTEGATVVAITGVQLLDEHEHPVSAISTGDPLIVRVHYQAPVPLKDPVFGMSFLAADRSPIATADTGYQRSPVGDVVGAGHIDCVFKSVSLMPGSYPVRVEIHDAHLTHTYDNREGDVTLHVQPGQEGQRVGVVDLGATWGRPIPEHIGK